MGIWQKARKLQYVKLFILLFMVGFLVGIVIANLGAKQFLNQAGIFGDYFFVKFQNTKVEFLELFWFVVQKRMKWIFLIWILSLTILGVPCIWVTYLWNGLLGGILLSLSVMRMGFGGILICFLGVLPQFFLYVPIIFLFLDKAYSVSLSQYGKHKKFSYSSSQKKDFLSYLSFLFLILVIMILGIFLESYVNPMIMKQILKIIF